MKEFIAELFGTLFLVVFIGLIIIIFRFES